MPKIFIGSIRKGSRTKDLTNLLKITPKVKSVKIIYPKAYKMTKGFAIFDVNFSRGMCLKKFKKRKILFQGTPLYIADYLEGDQITKRDVDLSQRKIYVSKIPRSASKTEFLGLFTKYGDVENAYISKEKARRAFLYGFVTFYEEEDAEQCVKLGKIRFKGVDLRVKKFTPKGISQSQNSNSDSQNQNVIQENGLDQNEEIRENEAQETEVYGQSSEPEWERNRVQTSIHNNNNRGTVINNNPPVLRRMGPEIDFSIRDGLWEILDVSRRNPCEQWKYRFNKPCSSAVGSHSSDNQHIDFLGYKRRGKKRIPNVNSGYEEPYRPQQNGNNFGGHYDPEGYQQWL